MRKNCSTILRMPSRCGCLGILTIVSLVVITLYMAFAFPYSLMNLKQTETSELKSVIIVARSGEKSPTLDSYFPGEDIKLPSDELNMIGFNQLTNKGKERMYLLGKFLKLKYYHLLLNGNPRKVQVRSSIEDRAIESAQSLLAGLLPPKDNWFWSNSGNELENWQPKAIYTSDPENDDLLAKKSNCFQYEQLEESEWRNSTKYQQLINEFKHDLQTMRSNTNLIFEDSLEMLSNIGDSLKTRASFKDNNVPAWYTNTLSQRLQHIVNVCNENKFKSKDMQRFYVGRLLHELVEKINTQIRLNQESLVSDKSEENLLVYQEENKRETLDSIKQEARLRPKPIEEQQANMFIYMTNKEKLSALLSSLKVYTNEPSFGSLFIIEIHYDPINRVHFLRLYTIDSSNPTLVPEPLRVNPIEACVDSVECVPQQFEQNLKHIMLDKQTWLEVCKNNLNQPLVDPSANNKLPLTPLIISENDLNVTPEANGQTSGQVATTSPSTTEPSGFEASSSQSAQEEVSETQESSTLVNPWNQLDENLIVGSSEQIPVATSETPNTDQPANGESNPITSGLIESVSISEQGNDSQANNSTETSDALYVSEATTLNLQDDSVSVERIY